MAGLSRISSMWPLKLAWMYSSIKMKAVMITANQSNPLKRFRNKKLEWVSSCSIEFFNL